jgi:hypothetical protein
MDIILLIKSIVGLVLILGVLIILFLYIPREKKREVQKKKISIQKSPPKVKQQVPLKELLTIIRDKYASTEELSEALEMIIKYYGKIHTKLGVRCHPDFDIYSEVLLRICRHQNTNKEIIVKFDKALESLNPEYVREINDSITKGLNSRGF